MTQMTVAGWAAAMLAVVALGAHPAQAAPPDLSGTWMGPFGVHAAGFPLMAGATLWAPASDGDPRRHHIPTLAEMMKHGDEMAAALKSSHGDPRVVRPPGGAPPAAVLTDAGRAAFAAWNPAVFQKQDLDCYPFNVFGRIGGGLGALEIAQSPSVIMMATEVNGHNFPRIIYMDGRSDANALPSWEGYSVGAWQGAAMHVVTTHIKGDYFAINWPVSIDARLTEDYRVQGQGKTRKLEIMQRLDDPQFYREPLLRVSYLNWRPDIELHDFPCEEGKDDQVEVTTRSPLANTPPESPYGAPGNASPGNVSPGNVSPLGAPHTP